MPPLDLCLASRPPPHRTLDPQDGIIRTGLAFCKSAAVLRRGPRRVLPNRRISGRGGRSFHPDPRVGETGASAHRPVARPETEGRFPAPGRDVATAATPAVTRNASGVLFEAAAAGLAEEARRGG